MLIYNDKVIERELIDIMSQYITVLEKLEKFLDGLGGVGIAVLIRNCNL